MQITSLSGAGVLSFDQLGLGLSDRVTFLVGPNGTGKSNLTRLLGICRRILEITDEAAGDANRLRAPSWRRVTSAPYRRACRPASRFD